MADLSFLGKVTDHFASGQTRRDCILRRYSGQPTTVYGGGRAKGDYEATPITVYQDPQSQKLLQEGGGAILDHDCVFYTRAESRGPDDITGQQGDEIIVVDTQDIFQIVRLNAWRKGLGDEIFCKRVGRVGDAPY